MKPSMNSLACLAIGITLLTGIAHAETSPPTDCSTTR
jgi:hypothetical protein